MNNADKPVDDRVSRRRYERQQNARAEAEKLLEAKSRELYLANQQLSAHSAKLEAAVIERTKELQEALLQAQAAGEAKSRFIATMSHEIRTPLGGMLGMIDLLAIDEDDVEKLELLRFAATAGKGLRRIVNDVLDFSKMEAGVFIFKEESVDVRALIESVRTLATSSEQTSERSVVAKVKSDVPQLFLGDATRIRQVISNLVSNALRYSEGGPVIIRASASDHKKGALLRVEVEDFGVGISEESIPDLFKDFSQVANPLTAAAQGAGLGLGICKRIMDGCGGTIGLISDFGEGSTFWFELPVTILQQSATAKDANAQDLPDENVTNILDGKRLLIAEDNIINQKMLLTYLERMNIHAQLAKNGRIALDMFDPEKFDLVLMDVAMPEMDGLEATRQIREKWVGSAMPPIIALTAHVMEAIKEEVELVGIDTVLSKPIPYEELKKALEVALTGWPTPKPAPTPTCEETTPTSILTKMSPPIVAELRDVCTDETIIELVHEFTDDLTQRIGIIEKSIAQDDFETASREGHSIKGSALVLGFPEITEWARQIEQETQNADQTLKASTEIGKAVAEIKLEL